MIILLMASAVFGQAVTYLGSSGLVTYTYADTSKKMDSCLFLISFPTYPSRNVYDTVRAYPLFPDSLTCYANVDLDSIGVHGVQVIPYFTDASSFTDNSGWTCDNRDTSFGSSSSPTPCPRSIGGSGDYDVRIYAKSGAFFLQGVPFRVTNSGGGTDYYWWTNADGYASASLDSGTWYVYGSQAGYGQVTSPETILVDSALYDTVLFTQFASDGAHAICYINMGLLQLGAPTRTYKLTATPNRKAWEGNTLYLQNEYATIDTSGLLRLNLLRSSQVAPIGKDTLKYTFIVESTSGERYYNATKSAVFVPDSTSFRITGW